MLFGFSTYKGLRNISGHPGDHHQGRTQQSHYFQLSHNPKFRPCLCFFHCCLPPDEFLILRVFVSLKFPFNTKIVEEFQCSVSIYVGYISRKHENFLYWPNKSHDVTIETPTNHSSSRWDIVFCFVEKNVGNVRWFVILKKGSSFQITLKLRRNHNINAFALMDISFTRLCPQPSNPNTVWKLRLSAFCICYT